MTPATLGWKSHLKNEDSHGQVDHCLLIRMDPVEIFEDDKCKHIFFYLKSNLLEKISETKNKEKWSDDNEVLHLFLVQLIYIPKEKVHQKKERHTG